MASCIDGKLDQTSELDIQAEIERYIAMPAQALAYTVGQSHIMNLRATAQQRLGAQFNIAEFHHQILGEGSTPLATLGEQVIEWIEAQIGSGTNQHEAGALAARKC